MLFKSENFVSISEANQNFSKVARLVDEKGLVIILKNNAPRYALLDYDMFCQDAIADNETLKDIVSRVMAKHIKAFEELAK
jgi:antitoxin Phd